MASNPRTPPRPPGRSGPTPQAPALKAPPAPATSVLEIELSHPIKVGTQGETSSTLRFVRPPGLGEIDGWLDESSPEAFGRSLEVLPFRPAWQVFVLSQCAGVPTDHGKKISVADLLKIGQALAPFVSGSPSTGEPALSGSASTSAGGRPTSES